MSIKPRPRQIAAAAPALGLLGQLVDEMHLHALEVAALGEALSHPGAQEKIVALQAFDAMSQRAMAFTRLLRALEWDLAGYGGTLEEAIAEVPFHDLRDRLTARVSGRSGAAPSRDSDDIDWF